MTDLVIRTETAADVDAIHQVVVAAFPTPGEADLVAKLRRNGHLPVSLVADADGHIVGHVGFSPVELAGLPGVLGLAPVAVAPDQQRTGIGSALIRAGLALCREQHCPLVVVLGEPEYYHRFGFERALSHGIANEYGVDEPFMAVVLRPDAWPTAPSPAALARYGAEFGELPG
jgi:putative acetyltransferase